jgi:homoserine kinase
MWRMIKIRVPATSANLGPGFDCLGLALDIWNEVSFEDADEVAYIVQGEGADQLNGVTENLLTAAFKRVHEICSRKMNGVKIRASNNIYLSSGLGSSAAAIVAGLHGANELLGKPLNAHEMLELAAEIEGHPDNVAPALLGGLVISAAKEHEIITRHYEIPPWTMAVVTPNVHWPTHVARSVLPASVPRADAVFNIGRTALVVDALRIGDLSLLHKVMEDRLHQPYRLEHIPAGRAAYQAALNFGAAALSGAGPSIIVFVSPEDAENAMNGIINAFKESGIEARGIITKPSARGAYRVM